jgi:hypothetical protein
VSIALISLVGVLLGLAVGRWWMILATAATAAAATALLMSSGGLADSPFVLVATLAAAGTAIGVVVRRRLVLRTRSE